jgi:opacity protein-like surface antigen
MSRFFLLTFLLGFTSMFSFAQRFEGGALAGLNASQVDGDTYSGYHKPGIVAGAYVTTSLSKLVFVGMELKFSQKGSRKNPDPKAADDQTKYIMRLSYAELPVYIGVRTSDRISVLAGLSASYLIQGTEYDNYGQFQEADRHSFNSTDIQGFLGFRFQVTKRLFVDLRGAYSLVPIRDQPGEPLSYWDSNQFSNLLSTTVLYRLDF